MKLHILSSHLQKKLGILSRAVSPRSQLPVLLNIALTAKEGKLQLRTTDLEIGIQVTIPASVEEKGEITIPAKTFSELTASFSPDEKISLIFDKTTLIVKTPKTKSILPTINQDEFPKLYEDKGEPVASLSQATLQKDLGRVIFAASVDIARPALSGVLITKETEEKDSFLLVATDGYRLSLTLYTKMKNKLQAGSELTEKQLLVPARIMREVIGLKDEKGDVVMYISSKNNQALFEQGETILVGRLIDAQFPAYEKIIPKNATTTVQFDKEEMHKAVKICAIFARETANIIKLAIEKDKIVVSANSASVGENSVEVEAKVTGDTNEIAFNARYLLELFAHIEEEDMILEMTGPLSPGVFKVKEDPSFLHLIMPIRVQG